MNKVYLLMGGNMGDVLIVFAEAMAMIEQAVGKIVLKSAVYKTAAWGMEEQPDFLNQVLLVESSYAAKDILKKILAIESVLGRKRKVKYGPRVIDIDILFYNEDIINTSDLKVPHPLLHQRNFTMVPLTEIAPDFVHPKLNKKILLLLKECTDILAVKRID